jgi:hypothetical protein
MSAIHSSDDRSPSISFMGYLAMAAEQVVTLQDPLLLLSMTQHTASGSAAAAAMVPYRT